VVHKNQESCAIEKDDRAMRPLGLGLGLESD